MTDKEAGLMWTQTDTMQDLEKWVNYQECMDYVRGLNERNFAGYQDWRLPTQDEMSTLFDDSYSNKDKFGKEIYIPDVFTPGCGFSMVAKLVSGRRCTWVLNLRDGESHQPVGLWTFSEAARAVRTIKND